MKIVLTCPKCCGENWIEADEAGLFKCESCGYVIEPENMQTNVVDKISGERQLIMEIEDRLTNRYKVLEGDGDTTLYVKNRETGEHLVIKVELLED